MITFTKAQLETFSGLMDLDRSSIMEISQATTYLIGILKFEDGDCWRYSIDRDGIVLNAYQTVF